MTSPKKTNFSCLPVDSVERKNYPIFEGCIKYFPAAIAGVANLSKKGNDKHNPGQPMHHARDKSSDHADCIMRHLIDLSALLAALERKEKINIEDILTEVNSVAWRALALSQITHETFGDPVAPSAKFMEKEEVNEKK